jgi:hypothetical protein
MKKITALCAAALLCCSCANINTASRYPNMVADKDPFSLGTIEASFDMLFSSKVKTNNEVDVVFYPRENKVALEFKYEFISYRQFWNQTARRQFTEALELYKKDFDARKLVTKYNKSRAVYGKIQGQLEWETFKFTTTYKSSPLLDLGYRFKDGSPYFTVLQRSAKEETGAISGTELESKQISMYYTKNQGDALAKLFNQEFLLQIAGVNTAENPEVPDPDEPARDRY